MHLSQVNLNKNYITPLFLHWFIPFHQLFRSHYKLDILPHQSPCWYTTPTQTHPHNIFHVISVHSHLYARVVINDVEDFWNQIIRSSELRGWLSIPVQVPVFLSYNRKRFGGLTPLGFFPFAGGKVLSKSNLSI